jgi:(p)ppGpp synthase/HD superfamily hydrolase
MSPKEMEALEFAVEHHAGQLDKQGKPYILHVLRVALENFTNCSENVFVAALLHDVVEDCGVKIGEIEQRWGVRIADAVDHLSRRKGESYSAYIERLREDHIAVRVKMADLTDNLMCSRIGSLSDDDQKRLGRRYSKALSQLSAKEGD